jgi:hypothetical protein
MTTICIVGSLNKVKVQAAKRGFAPRKVDGPIEFKPVDANPNIKEWRSANAVGQPFGVKQTGLGAINRLMHASTLGTTPTSRSTFVVCFENGLVPAKEVDMPQGWFDICFVALREIGSDIIIVKRGGCVLTEFNYCPMTAQGFNQSVLDYHDIVCLKYERGLICTKNGQKEPFR